MANTPPKNSLARKAPGRNGFKYRQQFGLVVVCRDEPHQMAVYQQLLREGHTVRVVVV